MLSLNITVTWHSQGAEKGHLLQDNGVGERRQLRYDSLSHLLSSMMSFRYFVILLLMRYTSPLGKIISFKSNAT